MPRSTFLGGGGGVTVWTHIPINSYVKLQEIVVFSGQDFLHRPSKNLGIGKKVQLI